MPSMAWGNSNSCLEEWGGLKHAWGFDNILARIGDPMEYIAKED